MIVNEAGRRIAALETVGVVRGYDLKTPPAWTLRFWLGRRARVGPANRNNPTQDDLRSYRSFSIWW